LPKVASGRHVVADTLNRGCKYLSPLFTGTLVWYVLLFCINTLESPMA